MNVACPLLGILVREEKVNPYVLKPLLLNVLLPGVRQVSWLLLPSRGFQTVILGAMQGVLPSPKGQRKWREEERSREESAITGPHPQLSSSFPSDSFIELSQKLSLKQNIHGLESF